MKNENNQSIKTVKEHLNNTAEDLFYGTHIVKHSANLRNHPFNISPKFYVLGFKALQ